MQAQSTVTGSRIMVRHLAELFGSVKFVELKVRDVDLALGQLAQHLSTRSVRLARMILIQAIRNAMVNDLVVRNAADLHHTFVHSCRIPACTATRSARLRVPLPSRSVRCSRAEERPTEAKTEPLGSQLGYQDLD
jgi:hypothetical protein